MSSKRTLFACTWCGAEQIMLDLDPRAVADATEAWHAEHDEHNPHHDKPRCCDDCGMVSPVQAVDHRTVIGLTTFDQQAHLDWLDDHDCTAHQSEQLKAWLARVDQTAHYVVRHDEDASTLLDAAPRPSWADSGLDEISSTGSGGYWSESLRIPVSTVVASVDDETIRYATVDVRAGLVDCRPTVALGHTMRVNGAVRTAGIHVMPDVARRAADALHAAADLAESA
ncbi:hypothetical protein nbrc107696_15710 [Gordonia spumicola]|uniref:Uncharacterized protein n=1 Tax=Gordonia spumicola TaxID=589161 RepID=A0A7I9V6X2_9ACTN|nr:hypothetical protein [Gordonia spumicola]GEE01125.1 hypothetical protein nbrc107696_15710 [Gordonia spumicola]